MTKIIVLSASNQLVAMDVDARTIIEGIHALPTAPAGDYASDSLKELKKFLEDFATALEN